MRVVFDAYAVIAALAAEPAAGTVEIELRRPNADPFISTVNVAEVVDHLVRVEGFPYEQVEASLELLRIGGLQFSSVDEAAGQGAGRLRARHYQKRVSEVSLADCVALATSLSLGAALATSDPALAEIARRERIRVIGLPDSRGRMP